MMSPIGLYLPEFTARAPSRYDGFAAPAPEAAGEADAEGQGDLSLRLEEARREGFDEGAATAREALVEQAAALGRHYAEQLEAERLRWAQGESAALAESLKQQLARLEDGLAGALADVLQPFLDRETRLKAVAELRDAIASLMANDAQAAIRVTGPADLIDALGGIGGVETEAAETPEVTLLAGDTVIRSKLQSWAAVLGSSREAQP